jgi:flagellum-specific ATP synthase
VAAQARDLLAVYRRNEDLITIGAYTRGANPKLDQAIDRREALTEFLKQPMEQSVSRREAWDRMASIVR